MQFRGERRALDDAIDELASQYPDEGASWRDKADLESFIRYLLATRTAYFLPTDWVNPVGDGLRSSDSPTTQDLVEGWRYQTRRPKTKQDCPTCWGTGQIPAAAPPAPASAVGRQRLVVSIAYAFRLLLQQLIAIDSRFVPPQGLIDIADWSLAQSQEHDRLLDWHEVSNPPRPDRSATLAVLEPLRSNAPEETPSA